MKIQAKIEIQTQDKRYKSIEKLFDNSKHMDGYVSFLAKHGSKIVGIDVKNVPDDTEAIIIDALQAGMLSGDIKARAQELLESFELI